MKKQYGIQPKPKTAPMNPLRLDLAGAQGKRKMETATKQVLDMHAAVIKALAKR